MDERFPKWLRIVVGKLDFIGLPNLGMFICGLAVLGFIGQTFLGAPMERFYFIPQMVWEGEWWRLFAFPVSDSLSNPIWFLFFVMYVYFVMGALEGQWGPGPLTVYTLFSYVCAIAGAMLAGRPSQIWVHVLENVSLAFGTLFPELELYLFFLLPVKAKWLAMFAGGLLLAQFLVGSIPTKIFLFSVMLPYLIFFGPLLVTTIRVKLKVSKNRKKFDDDMWR